MVIDIDKAHSLGLCKGDIPPKYGLIYSYMVLTYLHLLDPEDLPWISSQKIPRNPKKQTVYRRKAVYQLYIMVIDIVDQSRNGAKAWLIQYLVVWATVVVQIIVNHWAFREVFDMWKRLASMDWWKDDGFRENLGQGTIHVCHSLESWLSSAFKLLSIQKESLPKCSMYGIVSTMLPSKSSKCP